MTTGAGRPRPAILRDPVLDDEFHERGIVVVPFLDPDEVVKLRADYQAIRPPDDHGLTVDYMRPDRSVMAEVNELLAPLWQRHFPEVFADHRPALTTFVTKHPGEASNMFLHEDRTFVDERRYRAGTLWVPLVDIGPEIDNGCLFVIPRSHLLAQAFSGTGTPELFRPYEDYLRTQLEPLTVPAGSAAIYDTRTLHMSPANRTNEPREAIACSVVPRTAELLHVVATTRRHRRVHRVNDQFFVDVHPHAIDQDLPADYPVIEEYEDDSRLLPEDVAAVFPTGFATDTTSSPRPIYETGSGTLGEVIARSERRLPLLTDDLPLTAGNLPNAGDVRTTGMRIDTGKGLVGLVAVADGARVIEPLPPWADLVRPALKGARFGAIALLDAGSEARLQLAPTRNESWRIDVIDAALLGAAVTIGEHREILDETVSLTLAGGVDATLSNTGPGVLAILLTSQSTGRGTSALRTLTDRLADVVAARVPDRVAEKVTALRRG